MRKHKNYPKCYGPYLGYAIAKGFDNFVFFDKEPRSLFLLVEFKKPGLMADFAEDLGVAAEFGPGEERFRHVTMIADRSAVLDSDTFDAWNEYVYRVELSLPIKPTTAHRLFKKKLVHRWNDGQRPPGKLLIGVLDDGCPFAASQFLRTAANGAVKTQVRAIWDQNQGKQRVEIKKAGVNFYFGEQLTDFNYGLEYRRDSVGKQIGLDEWIQRHFTSTGSIDEDSCYADAGFTRVATRLSHGAHVMDVFAGRIPTSSRIGPTKAGQNHRDPPDWAVGDPTYDPACGADLVFVQFPEDSIRDATGVWLKSYVVAGIRYIMSCADPQKTENVLVNLSYGPTTGPHDGTHDLETALAELVSEFDGSPGKPKLEIFLAAGNSYLSEGHVRYKREQGQPNQIEWIWRLPPDNTVLCFSEVWMDTAQAGAVKVSLTSADGAVRVISSQQWGTTSTIWRLDVGATVVAPNIIPERYGDYRIKVEKIPQGAEVNAYVARSDPNMGVVSGAKRSYFVDPIWVRTRSAEAGCKYANGEFDNDGSLISRFGTLNGIATDQNISVHVAGGDMLMDGRKSPYASAGPARGNGRIGPDYAMFCDESYALQGVRAGGNRNGTVFRLIGTSAAAPQLARQFARTLVGVPLPQPSHKTGSKIQERQKRGAGDLEPP